MKAQQNKANPVKDIIRGDLKKLVCQGVEVFRITLNNAKFYKVEVKEMNKEENKNTSASPDHKA